MPQPFSLAAFRRIALAGLLAVPAGWTGPAAAQDGSAVASLPRFDAAAHPSPPRLTLDRRPPVCARFLDKITALYASQDPRFDFPSAPEGPDEQSYGAADAWGFARTAWLDISGTPGIERDFDGDGEIEILALIERPHGIYDKSALFLFRTQEELATAAGSFNPLDGALADGWATPVPLENEGAFFVFYPWNRDYVLGLVPLQLLAFTPQGKLEPACEVAIFPYPREDRRTVPKVPEVFGDGVARLVAALERSLGAPANCSVSNAEHADYANRQGAANAVYNTLYRPWVPLPDEGIAATVPDLHALTYLRDYWRYRDLWNFRVYREIEAALASARRGLERAYTGLYGAADLPRDFVESRLLGLISGFYLYVYNPGNEDPLAAALLSGDALDHIDGDRIVIEDHAYRPEDYRGRLTLALEHPALMAFLIYHGADVNAGNGFGKTPLMYAAHFGLIESARLLLASGADPNLSTPKAPWLPCDNLTWINRTALMYAAENASPAMIELLIASGADVRARDRKVEYRTETPDRGVAEYLARNAGLSADERQALIARWSIPTAFPQ